MDVRVVRVNFAENHSPLRSGFFVANREQVDNRLLQGAGYRKSSLKYQLLEERWQPAQVQPKGRLSA